MSNYVFYLVQLADELHRRASLPPGTSQDLSVRGLVASALVGTAPREVLRPSRLAMPPPPRLCGTTVGCMGSATHEPERVAPVLQASVTVGSCGVRRQIWM